MLVSSLITNSEKGIHITKENLIVVINGILLLTFDFLMCTFFKTDIKGLRWNLICYIKLFLI